MIVDFVHDGILAQIKDGIQLLISSFLKTRVNFVIIVEMGESLSRSEISENLQVNDQIFKRLRERGVATESGIRSWNVADSKLWYLTPKQAKGFIALESDGDYRRGITERETGLLSRHISDIHAELNEHQYNMIDLGCGDGKKAVFLISRLQSDHRFRYFPVDYSSYMVDSAFETMRSSNLGGVLKDKWNISDFENLSNVTPLIRGEGFQNNFLLLLGNTLGNFESDEMLHGIRGAMRAGDKLLIGNGLKVGNDEEAIKPYKRNLVNEFLIQVVEQAGLKPDEVEYDVTFRNSRVECFYRVKRDKTINHLGYTVDFKEGDEILTAISYKFSRGKFDDHLKKYFSNVSIFTDDEQAYAIAICSDKEKATFTTSPETTQSLR